MTFNTSALIQQLQQLEQQLADVPRHWDALQKALAGPYLGTALIAKMQAEHHLFAMEVTTGQLRLQVVPADGLGDELDSLSELALRAVRVVVLAELPVLRAVLTETAVGGRSRPPLPESFRTVDDVLASLRDELEWITLHWKAYRGTQGVERAAYRSALRVSHARTRDLGTASKAVVFLEACFGRLDWPDLQEASGRILASRAIQIDIDPDLPLLVHARPLHDVAGRAS